ncbi:hypothetical protein A2U01_0068944, partial [Trifolium medium]|nr:hypothetical protein [Trifolium medium]
KKGGFILEPARGVSYATQGVICVCVGGLLPGAMRQAWPGLRQAWPGLRQACAC